MAAPRLRDPAHRVSPRARWVWASGAVLEGAALPAALAVAGPLAGWLPLGWWVVVAAVVAVLVCAVAVAQWRYAVHRWEVTDDAVHTQTGWWTRERRIAPMSRVQTVDLAEGAVARLCGLASVTVTTASAAGPLRIAGLDRDRALALVDELTLRAGSADGAAEGGTAGDAT